MQITEVIYITKNKKCILNSFKFLVMTEDLNKAEKEALIKLKQATNKWELYTPIFGYRELLRG